MSRRAKENSDAVNMKYMPNPQMEVLLRGEGEWNASREEEGGDRAEQS